MAVHAQERGTLVMAGAREAAALLDAELVESAARSVLCWLATADTRGRPNVSPKEIFAVSDARRIVIANIASPGSARNIRDNPAVCLGFVDVFVQKGWKLRGLAVDVRAGEPGYERWCEPLRPLAGPRFPIRSVFVVTVQARERILAPSYRLYPGQTTEAAQRDAAIAAYRRSMSGD